MTRGFNSIVECTDQLAHHSQNVEHSLLVCWTGKEKPATRGHTRPSVSISMIKTFSLQTAIWTVNLVQLWFHHHQTAYMVYLVIYHVFFPPFLNLILSVKFHLKCLCFAQFEIALENNTWCCLRAEKYFEELEPASVCVCARAHSIKMADCRRFDKYFVPFSYPSLPSFWVISRYADWLQCTSFRSNLWCQNFIHSHWGFFLFILV